MRVSFEVCPMLCVWRRHWREKVARGGQSVATVPPGGCAQALSVCLWWSLCEPSVLALSWV